MANQPSNKEVIAAGLLQYLNAPDQSNSQEPKARGEKKKTERQSKRAGKPVKEYSNTASSDHKDRAKSRRKKEAEALKAMSQAMKKPRTESIVDRFKGGKK